MKSKFCYDTCDEEIYKYCKRKNNLCYQLRKVAEAWDDVKNVMIKEIKKSKVLMFIVNKVKLIIKKKWVIWEKMLDFLKNSDIMET